MTELLFIKLTVYKTHFIFYGFIPSYPANCGWLLIETPRRKVLSKSILGAVRRRHLLQEKRHWRACAGAEVRVGVPELQTYCVLAAVASRCSRVMGSNLAQYCC